MGRCPWSSRCAQHCYRVPRRGRQEAQRRHAGGAGRTWKTRRLADGPRAQDSAASRSRENKDEALPWSVQEEPTLPTSGALRSSTCHVSLPGAFLGHRGNRKQMRPPAHGCGGRTPRQPPAVPWSSNRLFCERGQKDGHRVACPGIPAQSGRNVGVRLLVAVGTRSRRPEARIPARGPRSPDGLSLSLCGLGLSEAQNKVGAGGHSSPLSARRVPSTAAYDLASRTRRLSQTRVCKQTPTFPSRGFSQWKTAGRGAAISRPQHQARRR